MQLEKAFNWVQKCSFSLRLKKHKSEFFVNFAPPSAGITELETVKRFLLSIRPPWLRYLLAAVTGVLLACFGFVATVYVGFWGPVPGKSSLRDIELDRASEIYSADSVLIGKLYRHDRQPVALEDIPQHTLDALVAIEDERFYRHSGIDYPSLMRVLTKSILLRDEGAGGGSTLSQQLAKNLFPRRGSGKIGLAADKVREMITARRLEGLYSKEDILQLYLNTVSFGDNSFGIESAARKFFNKPTSRLRPEEAATLIGMLKATHSYNPRLFPDRSLARRNLVLEAMYRNDYLEEGQKDSLQALPLVLDYRPASHDLGLAPYFREAVRREAARLLAEKHGTDSSISLYTSGLKIYTTLNAGMQQLAEAGMQRHMAALQAQFETAYGANAPWKSNRRFIDTYIRQSPPYRKLAAAGLEHAAIMDSLARKRQMVLSDWEGDHEAEASTLDSLLHYAKFLNTGQLAIEAHTGAVLTWLGGIDYKHFKYDHVWQSERQVGSTFKPVVYATALERGADPCQHYSARQVQYENLEDWAPSNSGDKEEAYLNYSMQEALRNSVNTVAVKVLEETGIDPVVDQAHAMGITSDLPRKPSLALGTGSVRVAEMAGAYASFVNHGRPVKPYFISSVSDKLGEELYRHEAPEPAEPALSERTRLLMLEMLQSVVNSGTASRLREQYGVTGAIGGKTGTTQNNKDAWFVAVTPELVHVTWVGLERHEIGFPNTRIGQGANAALPMFAYWYRGLKADPELRHWTTASFPAPPEDIREALDCPPVKRDGFFKRLFTNPDRAKKRKFREGTKK